MALAAENIVEKIKLTSKVFDNYIAGNLGNYAVKIDVDLLNVGFPSNLQWVEPRLLPQRPISSPEGRAALLHSIAHIEFNAINIALDAVARFDDMPAEFYGDWLQVAREEAYHFHLLNTHLKAYGVEYGDLPVHNGLWQMTQDTNYAVLVRMALVPRLLEARGLDVAPMIAKKFHNNGDKTAADILWIIMHDEVNHVRIGNKWYHYCCQQLKLNPFTTFTTLLEKHAKDVLRKPFNWEKRLLAGFTEEEKEFIESKC